MKSRHSILKKLFNAALPVVLLCAFQPVSAQTGISGRVTDESGEGLIGVAVIVETDNARTGVVTDENGIFYIDVPEDTDLEFNYMGFKSVILPAKDNMLVVMEEDRSLLEESVVVGYGSLKKKDILGSVSTVRHQELQNRISGNMVESMRGLVSGVKITSSGTPGSNANIQIRGIGSLSGGTSPLFIIDGSYGGSEVGLSVEDIESIQILKDASSAAIYGSRAANGVVIITTKKGTTGELKVKFDGSAQMYWLPKYDLMDAETYKYYDDLAYQEAMMQGVPGVNDLQNHLSGDSDFLGAMLKTGIIQNYNVSMSGGTETLNFYTSLNYKKDDGAMMNTGHEQFGFRVNTGGKKGIFEYGQHLFFSKTKTDNLMGNPWASAIQIPPTIPIYDDSNPGGFGYGKVDGANSTAVNPVAMESLYHSDNPQQYLYADIYGQINLWENHLNAKLNVSYKNYLGETNTLRKKGNWTMSQGDDSAFISYATAAHDMILVENTYNFNYDIKGHSINAVAGFSFNTMHEKYKSQTKLDPLVVGDKYITSFDSATGTQTCTGSYIEYALISYFGRINYSYGDRYLIQLTARRDGTSRLPKENRWGNFGSVSLGWRISNEPWFDVNWIDDLKLRANYGTLGNTNIGPWDYQSVINTAPRAIMNGDTKVVGMTQSNITNMDLVWEKKTSANVGVDFLALRKRLTASVEYYYSKSKDLLFNLPILMTTGNEGGAPMVNAASLRNTGVELEIGWNDIVGDFGYSVNANFSTVSNKVLSLGYGQTVYYTYTSRSDVGQPLGMWYLYKKLGIFQSEEDVLAHVNSKGQVIQPDARPGDIIYDDYNDDGQITSEDRQIVGSPWPKLEAGLNISLSWKNLDLSINGYGRFGHLVYNAARATAMDFTSNQNNFADFVPWTQSNPSTENPRIIYGDTRNSRGDQDRWLEDGSFFRIGDITLGYTLPRKWLKAVKFEEIRLSVTGRNLLTFTGYSGLDPEFADRGVFTIGYDGCSFPNPRSVQFAVSFTF